jgi:hypothetical protein
VFASKTLVSSWIHENGDVIGEYLDSITKVPSIHHLVARNICQPYTIIHYNHTTAVLSAPCPGAKSYGLMSIGGFSKLIPLNNFIQIKYDYTERKIYTLSHNRSLISVHNIDTFELVDRIFIPGNVSNFYSVGGKVFYVLERERYYVMDASNNFFLSYVKDGRIDTYYVPNSSTSHEILTLLMLITILTFIS